MSGSDTTGFAQEAVEVERLVSEIHASGGSLVPVYRRLDEALQQLDREGIDAADLLPADTEPGLGFSLRKNRDGATLWKALASAVRARVCPAESAARAQLMAAAQAGNAALVGAVVTALGLSAAATPFAVALAGFILAVGIDDLCLRLGGPSDEPSPA